MLHRLFRSTAVAFSARRQVSRRGGLRALVALLLAAASPVHAASLQEARELAATGKVEQALGAVDEVLAERPEDVPALLLRGVLLSRSGRSDEAIEVFNAIARLRPDLPEPHNNLAVLYAAQGRYEEARGALVEAIRLQPDYALAHENLGDVYAKLAALSYARANQIEPRNGSAAEKSAAAENLIAGQSGSGAAVPDPAPRTPTRVNARTAPPTPAVVAGAGAGTATCVRVKAVTPRARAEGVARWLEQRGLQTELSADAGPAPSRTIHRVLIPSQGSAADARRRIAELRGAGISDLIMITDGDERYGISLGVYSQRRSAERRVRQLQDLGIETRIVELNRTRPSSSTVTARGDFPPADFARAFPDLLPEVVECR